MNNTWEGDDGQRRYRTEIHASEVVFLDSRNGNGNGGQVNDGDASDVEETVAPLPSSPLSPQPHSDASLKAHHGAAPHLQGRPRSCF